MPNTATPYHYQNGACEVPKRNSLKVFQDRSYDIRHSKVLIFSGLIRQLWALSPEIYYPPNFDILIHVLIFTFEPGKGQLRIAQVEYSINYAT